MSSCGQTVSNVCLRARGPQVSPHAKERAYEARTHLWRVGNERGDGDEDPRHACSYSANRRGARIPQVPVYRNPNLPNLARR